tara:strand:- start:60 stop:698 length:639 start_codon:yes stop_codon:yes gene_type:complete
MLKKENKLVESINEHKPKFVLRDLDEYPSEKTVKAVDFRTEYGITSGIYIAFLKSDLPDKISAKKLYDELFEKSYIEKSLYIGVSTNILERCTAMRGTSMNNDPHAIARYRNANPEISCNDIILLSILLDVESKNLKSDFETNFHDICKERTGKRFIAEGLSSVNGVDGTRFSGVIANITSSTEKEELKSIISSAENRLKILEFAELMGQPL